LTGPKATEQAPWISPRELQHLIADVDAHSRRWTADALGDRVELSFEEKIGLDIRNIACFDKPKHEVNAFYHQRRRERDAKRKRDRRAAKKKDRESGVKNLSPRASAVFEFLRGEGWACNTGIAAGIRELPAFKGLSWESTLRAVGRAVDELVKSNAVEVRMERTSTRHTGTGTLYHRIRFVRLRDQFKR